MRHEGWAEIRLCKGKSILHPPENTNGEGAVCCITAEEVDVASNPFIRTPGRGLGELEGRVSRNVAGWREKNTLRTVYTARLYSLESKRCAAALDDTTLVPPLS